MPDSNSRKALIAGATGAVGRHLLSMLLSEPRYDEVHVLTRRPLAHSEPKLYVHEVDFEQLAGHAELFAVDDVFCCLGSTIKQAGSRPAFERVDHDYVVELSRLAKQGGAQRFVMISAVGANPKAMAFYSRVKGRAETDVLVNGPATVHIMRPSLLVGEREEHRTGEAMAQAIMPALNPLLCGKLRRYRAVETREVAEKMLQLALEGPEGHSVHHFFES